MPDSKTPHPWGGGKAQGPAIGEAIESGEWTLTLVDTPLKAETVGAGTNCGPSGFSAGCLTAAEGVFLIAPVELTSRASELKMISNSDSKKRQRHESV